MGKRLMQILVVIIAIGAMIQTVANAVEKKESSKPVGPKSGTAISGEPGI